MNGHQFNPEDSNSTGEVPPMCAQVVLKCLCLANIDKTGLLVNSVNRLAISVTYWKKNMRQIQNKS